MQLMTENLSIILSELGIGYPGLTEAQGMVLAEAAYVCLSDQGHLTETCLEINGDIEHKAILCSSVATQQMKNTHNDEQCATEDGASGIAILILKKFKNLIVLQRSRKGRGFDYWLGKDNGSSNFDEQFALEVTGIRNGKERVNERLNSKLKRFERYESRNNENESINKYVVVIEFSKPLAKIKDLTS